MVELNGEAQGAPSVGMAQRHECGPCLVRQAREAAALAAVNGTTDPDLANAVERLVTEADRTLSPPALALQVQQLIRLRVGDRDLYADIKHRLNELAAALYPEWHRRFLGAHPPLEAAVRLAIVGNLLDVGANVRLDDDAVVSALESALTQPLVGSLPAFAEAIQTAQRILYLADNAGEIVFDRDLLALLPQGRVTVVVRGGPILNDATLADAQWAGLTDLYSVITNGSNAPGTVLEDCSPDFLARFEAADLIISKGQGNYETLAGVDRPIFFLLKVKCPVLAEALHSPTGSLVVRQY